MIEENKIISLIQGLIKSDLFQDKLFLENILKIETEFEPDVELIINSLKQKYYIKNNNIYQKEKGKFTKGYLDGCFDVTHSGHYNAIRQAKQLCDYLIVGINSDEDIRKFKGNPIMNIKERYEIAKNCKWIDEVILSTPYIPSIDFLDSINCDFIMHGDDIVYDNGKNIFQEFIDKGRMKVFKRTEGISTTDILGRLLCQTKDHIVKNPTLSFSKSKENLLNTLNINKNKNKFFIQTTRRIKEFSNNSVPKKNDKIVYVMGSFDIFHHGHINFLEKAKKQGDYLIVGLLDDNEINNKIGENHPIINLNERVLCVLSCKFVDDVIIGCPNEINEYLMKQLNIDIVVKGNNCMGYDDQILNKMYEYPKSLNKYVEINSDFNFNINSLAERVIDNRKELLNKAIKKSKGEENYYNKNQFVQEI